jgi:hypothetical protein
LTASIDGGTDGFRAWVTTIGRHRALDHLRARKRRVTEPAPIEALLDVPADEDTMGEVIEAMTTRAALEWIGTLPRDQARGRDLAGGDRPGCGLGGPCTGQAAGRGAHRRLPRSAAWRRPWMMPLGRMKPELRDRV